jgi:hypothetical protein
MVKIKVKVTGAPGFEDFEGHTTADLHKLTFGDGQVRSLVKHPEGEFYVFKSEYVEVIK